MSPLNGVLYIQSPSQPLTAMEKQGSASPRPPPLNAPPPIPPTKPEPQSITETSMGIPIQFDSNDSAAASNSNVGSKRTRNRRRRRASLPAMNILPSFKSLKSVMGFGADHEEEEKEDSESHRMEPIHGDMSSMVPNGDSNRDSKGDSNDIMEDTSTPNTADSKGSKPSKGSKADKSAIKSEALNGSSHFGDEHNAFSKRKYPKKLKKDDVKAMYIKNMKLQAEVDRVNAQNKKLIAQLDDARDEIGDLKDQIEVKNDLVQQLNTMSERVSESKEDVTLKYKQLEQLVKDKDSVIESLKGQIKTLQREMEVPSQFTIGVGDGDHGATNGAGKENLSADDMMRDPHKQHVEFFVLLNSFWNFGILEFWNFVIFEFLVFLELEYSFESLSI